MFDLDWVALPALVIAVVHAAVNLVNWFRKRPPRIPPRANSRNGGPPR